MNPGRPYGHGILIPAPLTRLGRPRERPVTGDPGSIKNPSGFTTRTYQLARIIGSSTLRPKFNARISTPTT